MSNERIDLTQFRIMTGSPPDEVDLTARHNFSLGQAEVLVQLPDLISELKRCYEREDALTEALKIIRDDLDDALEIEGYNTLAHEKSERTLQKIRNFANDASE